MRNEATCFEPDNGSPGRGAANRMGRRLLGNIALLRAAHSRSCDECKRQRGAATHKTAVGVGSLPIGLFSPISSTWLGYKHAFRHMTDHNNGWVSDDRGLVLPVNDRFDSSQKGRQRDW